MSLYSVRGALIITLATAILGVLALGGEGAHPVSTDSQRTSASTTKADAAIPVADAAARATEVSNFLLTLKNQLLVPNPEIVKIRQRFASISNQIASEGDAMVGMLDGRSTLAALQTKQQFWEAMQQQTSEWLNVLTTQATQMQKGLDRLGGLQVTWAKTLDAAVAAGAPAPILLSIHRTLASVEEAKPPLQERHAVVLDLQSRVAQLVTRCGTALSSIALAQKEEVGGILTRDGLPIWSAELWENALAESSKKVCRTVSLFLSDIRQYLKPTSRGFRAQVGLFAVLAFLFLAARRQVVCWAEADERRSPYTRVFDHPLAAAVLVPLLIGSAPTWQSPPMVRQMFNVLALLPMIQITKQGFRSNVMLGIYALGVLFALDTVRQALAGASLLERGSLLFETAGVMALVGWSLGYGPLRYSCEQGCETLRLQELRALGRLVLLSLVIVLLGGLLGYLRLGRLLVSGLTAGGVLALSIYCLLKVASGFVAFALHIPPVTRLRMVQQHRALFENRIHRFLVWTAIFAWLVRSLDYVGLLEPAESFATAALSAEFKRGSLSISLGDVLAFAITVLASYLISSFIRFVLREDVYPRTRIAVGLSYAISSLLHYLILTLGFILGLAVLGIDLTRLTVMAGALGVGIGFGLQSVVNNFVSGLILLFERPVHVGDIIEIENLLGEVRQIGIRASKVRTRQGADIVVPNAQLVTERLTNWTLGDRLRRIEIPVGVNYGAKPQKVIAVLEKVARSDPRVLAHPPPRALFMSYGDSSINFELRAWTDDSKDWRKIRSDLGIALYDAVQVEGMQFPFPQREVRLVHDSRNIEDKLPNLEDPLRADTTGYGKEDRPGRG